MTDPYLKCRVLGHAWDEIPVTKRPEFGVYMWFRCERCSTLRYDIVNQFNGDLLSRSYQKPSDYKREKTSFKDLRVELIRPKRQQGGSKGKRATRQTG